MVAVWRITAEKPPVGTAVGPSVNVWHVKSTAGSITDAQAAVDKLKQFYDALTAEIAGGSDISIGSSVTDISVTPPTFMPVTAKSSHPLGVTPLLPAQCAFVVSWKTVFAGPSFRGRTYIGPLSGSSLDGSGNPIAATFTHMNTAIALITAYNGTLPPNDGFVVYSQYHGKTAGGDPIKRVPPIASGIIGGVFRSKVYTQRRRSS